MAHLIDKDALVAKIENCINRCNIKKQSFPVNTQIEAICDNKIYAYKELLFFINTLEVKDPYEQCIQYDSIEAGIQEHAEIYSFNIESELFNQLTKEQQALWRKEIEQACISGGEAGVELARDPRYKENLELKEVDLEKEMQAFAKMELEPLEIYDDNVGISITMSQLYSCARHFFKLGLKAQKGE